jgi:hypothetical protein
MAKHLDDVVRLPQHSNFLSVGAVTRATDDVWKSGALGLLVPWVRGAFPGSECTPARLENDVACSNALTRNTVRPNPSYMDYGFACEVIQHATPPEIDYSDRTILVGRF